MMPNISCVCGVTEKGPRGASVGDISLATGFLPVFDQSNGLTTVWLCPTCWSKCKPAISVLMEVFGKKAEYIHYPNLLRHLKEKRRID